jgi:hypothetical protein
MGVGRGPGAHVSVVKQACSKVEEFVVGLPNRPQEQKRQRRMEPVGEGTGGAGLLAVESSFVDNMWWQEPSSSGW